MVRLRSLTHGPMTQNTWQQEKDFRDSDKEYQEFDRKDDELREAMQKAQQKMRGSIWKIQRILHGVDVVRSQITHFEDLTEDENETLIKYTTDCGECWAGTYDGAADDFLDLAVEQAHKTTMLKWEYDSAKRAWDEYRPIYRQACLEVHERFEAEMKSREELKKQVEEEEAMTELQHEIADEQERQLIEESAPAFGD